jgi:4-amino-4-deoxy-L-arabinose transferase-like glycosyltransferase
MSALALVAALASIGLMYGLGARMFGSARWGILAAGVFAATPLLWQQSRNAPVSLYPLPFVLGWLFAVAHLGDERGAWWAAAAGAVLGVGAYSSLAATVMMPLYVLLTIAMVAPVRPAPFRRLGAFVAAFVAAVAPFALSLVRHPDDFRRTVDAYHLYDTSRFNVLQGVHEMVSWVGLTARSEVYYDYFNPAFLFLTGGVLLCPLAVLLPAGLYRIVTDESTPLARLSLGGFLAAPFAASLTAEPPTPRGILFITPFAAIVAVYGVQHLLSLRMRRH